MDVCAPAPCGLTGFVVVAAVLYDVGDAVAVDEVCRNIAVVRFGKENSAEASSRLPMERKGTETAVERLEEVTSKLYIHLEA
jgi:hypothetical protein